MFWNGKLLTGNNTKIRCLRKCLEFPRELIWFNCKKNFRNKNLNLSSFWKKLWISKSSIYWGRLKIVVLIGCSGHQSFQIFTDSCIKENSAYVGGIGVVLSYVSSIFLCQYNCQYRNWCTVYTFHKMLQYCLLSGSLSVGTQFDPYLLTGTRTCGNYGSEF